MPANSDSALLPHLRSLRVLLAVVKHGSTVAAAQAIHLSQPAITRSIHRLEQACGQLLFIRTTRGMRPMPQGQQLAQRTGTLLERLETGAREAMSFDTNLRTRPQTAQRFASAITASQMRALIAVATWGSESQAAIQLGISQPAIYAALQELEQLLEIGLFYKLPSGTRLTPPGEALLLRVKQAVAELRSMAGDIAAWQGQTRGHITLGVLPLSTPIFLPQALQMLMSRYPDIQVKIIDGAYEDLRRLLLSADIDTIVGALRLESSTAEMQQHALFDDDLVIIAPRDHPCFQCQELQLVDLLRWSWVAPLPHTPADRIWRSIFSANNLPIPSDRLSAGSPIMTQALVLQSGLLALASRSEVQKNSHAGALCIVPVELSGTTRKIGITTRATTMLPPDLQAFLVCCRQTIQMLPVPMNMQATAEDDGIYFTCATPR